MGARKSGWNSGRGVGERGQESCVMATRGGKTERERRSKRLADWEGMEWYTVVSARVAEGPGQWRSRKKSVWRSCQQQKPRTAAPVCKWQKVGKRETGNGEILDCTVSLGSNPTGIGECVLRHCLHAACHCLLLKTQKNRDARTWEPRYLLTYLGTCICKYLGSYNPKLVSCLDHLIDLSCYHWQLCLVRPSIHSLYGGWIRK